MHATLLVAALAALATLGVFSLDAQAAPTIRMSAIETSLTPVDYAFCEVCKADDEDDEDDEIELTDIIDA